MCRIFMIFNLLWFFSIAGCSTNDTKDKKNPDDSERKITSYHYLPILPIPVPKGLKNAQDTLLTWDDNKQALNFLHNEALRITLGRSEGEGAVSYGVGKSNAKISSGVYTLDAVRYTAIPYRLPKYSQICLVEPDERCAKGKWFSAIAILLVGVGARAEITFDSVSGSLDISSLLTLGAKSSNVSGRINLSSIGVTSASISPLLTSHPNLSTENIESSLKSLEAIKLIATFSGESKETSINPQILAVDPGDMPMDALMADFYRVSINPEEYSKRLE